MRRKLLVLTLALSTIALGGCAAFRVMNPFSSVSAADAEWSGVSGLPVSLVSTLLQPGGVPDPRGAAAAAILELSGLPDQLGVLLPLTPAGETTARWVLCTAEWAAKCRAVPINSRVDFAGSPVGPGVLWRPKRLKF